MENKASAVLNLPNNETTFTVDVEGEVTGNRYTGSFTAICVPNQRQKAAAALLESEMLVSTKGDLSVLDENTRYFIKCIAQLQFRLIKFPTWWQESDGGRNLYDINPIVEAMSKALDAENEWRKKAFEGKKTEPKFTDRPPTQVDDTIVSDA